MTWKPSDKEDEYFAREEFERLRKLQEERGKHIAEKERQNLKQLHYMRCPKCGMELKEIDYRGLKIDKCFSCEGLWLDAGELERIANLEKKTLDKVFGLFR